MAKKIKNHLTQGSQKRKRVKTKAKPCSLCGLDAGKNLKRHMDRYHGGGVFKLAKAKDLKKLKVKTVKKRRGGC